MKALVTGGAGFIGSNLVDELIKQGHEVIVVDDESAESNSQFYWNENAQNNWVDILDKEKLEEVFEKHKPEYVFHLAAFARIPPSIKDPLKSCQVNFIGTCNLLQCCRNHGVKRIMYSGTSAAYGLKNKPPLREDMKRDCLNPYSVSKTAAEDLIKMYYTLYGLECIMFRYFNIYGERQPTSGQYSPVVGIFLRQKEAGEKLTIVGDGLQRRDFTHVSDVVSANIMASETKNKKAIGEIFNIGRGNNYSVLEIANMIDFNQKNIPQREGEAKTTLADISKIKEMIGWEPKINVDEWIKKQLEY
jgi:UDP-glucose 4-epimerase